MSVICDAFFFISEDAFEASGSQSVILTRPAVIVCGQLLYNHSKTNHSSQIHADYPKCMAFSATRCIFAASNIKKELI